MRGWDRSAEISRINHLIDNLQEDFSRIRKTQWIRNAMITFVGTLVGELAAYNAPITRDVLVSMILAALAAIPPAVDPKINRSALERKIDEIHHMTVHGIVPPATPAGNAPDTPSPQVPPT